MGTEHRFRNGNDRGVDPDELDWVTPAEELQIPLEQARALYEEALRRAMYPGSRPARDLYCEWLADCEPEASSVPPGRRTLTMRLGQRHRRGPARRSHAPGKHPLTAHLDRPRPRGAEARAGAAGWALAQAAERHAVTLLRREAAAGDAADPEHPAVAEALRRRGSGEPLPEAVRRDMEARLGADLQRVRVHTDAVAQHAAAAVQARAFTVGEDVFFAAAAFQPDSAGGRELLAHELAHVVQGHRGHLPATSGPHLTAPGDAVEREADAMAHEAMRAPAEAAPADAAPHVSDPSRQSGALGAAEAAPPTAAPAAPHAGAAASLLIARDPPTTGTATTPADWPPADDRAATEFWDAAQPAFGFTDTETDKAEAERIFNIFKIFKSRVGSGGWQRINENLVLYCEIADTNAELGRREADHDALIPIFARLLGLDPSISNYPDDVPVLWENARTTRGWERSDVEAIYRVAIQAPFTTSCSIPTLATALADEDAYFVVAEGFWTDKADQVRVLPGFLYFKEHAPAQWQSADGFSIFADPIVNTPTIDRVESMVIAHVVENDWLNMPLDGTLFWAGGDPAATLAVLYSAYKGTLTPVDPTTTDITWTSPPPSAGLTGTISNGQLGAILANTNPLWDLQAPNDFTWPVGGEIFFQGLSKVLAARARGIATVLFVGAPRDNPSEDHGVAVFLTTEMPELIRLRSLRPPLITGLDFLCFPYESTEDYLEAPGDLLISDLCEESNGGLHTPSVAAAETWVNSQRSALGRAPSPTLATLRAKWEAAEAAGAAGGGPVISFSLGDLGVPGATLDVTDDLPAHPGLQIESVHLELTDEATVASGSITATIAAGEMIQIQSVTYDLTPTTGEIHATASNSVADRTSGTSPFGDLLAGIPVDWDVHVVAGGLAVSLTLTDPIPLPGGLSIEAAEGVLSYTGGEGLTGTISVTVTNGTTITGTVELGYRDGRYRIGGTLEVTGLVEGLAPFAVEMDYGGPADWRVGLADGSCLSVSTALLGVPVSGVIEQLEMGSANRLSTAAEGTSGSQTAFSASGSLTADLPLIGPVEAGISIVNNQLDTVSLTAERGFSFPAGDPMVSGTVTGTATYHVQTGALEGGLSGTASVTVPGIAQPVAVTFALAAGPAGFTVNASVVGEVELNHFLRLTALSASYADGQLTLVGGAAVQNLGNVDASVRVRIDETGLHLEEGSASVTFGDASFGGEATFRYSETAGFGFDGHLDIEVLPGKRVRLAIAYPSEGEGGVAEEGTFDASVTLPPPEGGEGASAAGWQLWAGVQPEEPTPLFTAPHVSIPIFSIGLATATIEIDAALLYTLAVDPLTVAGSLAVEGINLADPEQPFRKITVTGTAQSGITGQLIFEPEVALGLSVVHPFLAGIRGGVQLPVTATAGLDIEGDVALEFTPGGGASAQQATVTAPLSFSVVATPHLFAQLEALGGIIAPPAWQSDDLAELTLFEEKKLLEVVFDLAHPDRGVTVHTFDPTAPAASSPTGMPMTPRAPTMTAGSASAAALANNAAVSTTTSDATGTTSGGGMDFGALLTAVSGAMPQPVQDLISTLQSLWTTIEPIVNKVIEFLDWISASIRSIFTDEEVQRLLTEVLPQLASGDLSNIADAVGSAIDIGLSVVQRLVAPLVQSGDVAVLRRRKDKWAGIDEADPDEYSYRFHIPGLLDVSGQGSDAALSAMVRLLQDQLGVPISDLDDVQPPHMIGYYADNNAGGDIIGSSTDGAQTLRGGEQFHHDCMSSVKGYGVTAGTTLHLYEHGDSQGDYTRITFGTAPEPEPTVDENGLEQRKPATITVNIGSGGENASWAVIRGSQLNDKVSTVVITSSTDEPSR